MPEVEVAFLLLFVAVLLIFFAPRLVTVLLGKTTRRKLTNVTPTKFEYKVADYYEKLGYDPLVTRQSGEDGVDIIARKNGEAIAVQAKRYQLSNKVSTRAVENTHMAMKRVRADRAAVVTSSSFTNSAVERAEELGVNLVTGSEMVMVLDE